MISLSIVIEVKTYVSSAWSPRLRSHCARAGIDVSVSSVIVWCVRAAFKTTILGPSRRDVHCVVKMSSWTARQTVLAWRIRRCRLCLPSSATRLKEISEMMKLYMRLAEWYEKACMKELADRSCMTASEATRTFYASFLGCSICRHIRAEEWEPCDPFRFSPM